MEEIFRVEDDGFAALVWAERDGCGAEESSDEFIVGETRGEPNLCEGDALPDILKLFDGCQFELFSVV